jgi:predicted transposase/invertase (TIGR01784 family)
MDETLIPAPEYAGVTDLAADGLTAILPAFDDHVFKSHVSNPLARPGLSELISDIVKRPVAELAVRQNEIGVQDSEAKASVLDVNCAEGTDGKGDQFNVEMNANQMKGDNLENEQVNLRCRMIYNMCELHASQSAKGKQYSKLVRTYQITFANYETTPEKHKMVEWYSMRNDENKLLSDHINAILIDLTFATEIAKKSVDEMTNEEMWVLFFAQAHNPKYSGKIDEIRKVKKGVNIMYQSLTNISSNPDERARLISLRRLERDRDHNDAVIRDERDTYWQGVVTEKDAALSQRDAEIANLRAQLAQRQ